MSTTKAQKANENGTESDYFEFNLKSIGLANLKGLPQIATEKRWQSPTLNFGTLIETNNGRILNGLMNMAL